MKDVVLSQLEARFGKPFVSALRRTVRSRDDDVEAIAAWQVGEAKDHFSEVLDRIRNGESQMVRRRSDEPVLMMSIAQLAAFVELAAPKRQFAESIRHDPDLPVGRPLRVAEGAIGRDEVDL